jgi:hypothetical protein
MPQFRSLCSDLARAAALTVLAYALAACAPDARECVPGDQTQCRCGDDSFGYRTCDQSGRFSGHCDCILGLIPDAGMFMGSVSGQGMGHAPRADAGGQ